MGSSAVVLLSGGLDSAVNLAMAKEAGLKVSLCLTFDYGQRAAKPEIRCAKELAEAYGSPHKVLELPWLGKISTSSLNQKEKSIPQAADVDIESRLRSEETARQVWVPNRNGLFLNVAAVFAEALGAQYLVPGFNKEEAETFPDNSVAFLNAINTSLEFSTANQVQTQCFTKAMNKTEIYAKGIELNLPFHAIWPCYFGEEVPCGKCESCLRYQRAKLQNIGTEA